MKKNKLGSSSMEVSKVCLGTMTFGEQNSQDESYDQMNYSFENGVNFFDTAEMYPIPGRKSTQGNTEKIIGNWLEETGSRDQIYLASKVTGCGVKWIRGGTSFSKEHINRAVDGSLTRLKVEAIDLYQLHWPVRANNKFGNRIYPWYLNEGYKHDFMAILETLEELLKSGKIKNWGLSNETSWGMMKFIQLCDQYGLTKPISTQNSFSLMNRLFEYGASEVAQFENIGLMAYSPLAFGLLSGKYLNGARPKGSRLTDYPIFERFLNPQANEAVKKFKNLAAQNGLSLSELSLAFVMSRPFVSTTIIGATKMNQLKENVEAAYIELPQSLLAEIEDVFNQNPDAAV
jgi:aryl-alcohol dehydrogenase-like predicted oxidoreductase